jgi:hypothetical protein
MTTKKKDIHICSECLGEFSSKDLYVAEVPDREYYTTYCEKCMKKIGIKKCRNYTSNTFKNEFLYLDKNGLIIPEVKEKKKEKMKKKN